MIEVHTLGCRLNAQESELIREQAAAAGLQDTVIVNTCAVTGEAVRQARQRIRRLRREKPGARIVVTGCAAELEPLRFAQMAEVDLVVGNAHKTTPQTWVSSRARLHAAGDLGLAAAAKIAINDKGAIPAAPQLLGGFAQRFRAFVQVQNGCDHRCTFCIIPFARGNSRSLAMGEVVSQIRRLVARGYREVVLTGVDITSYGCDLPGAPRLGRLLAAILKHVPQLERLRLSSIDIAECDGELLEVLAREPRLMPHLHLSLQSGDDLILKRMRRRHLRADAVAFCERVRRLREDVVFGADLIAGFPTETEDMFARSLELVDACGLVHLHVFPYSPRPGTAAVRMPQLPHQLIKDRARRLRERGQEALRRRLAAEAGKHRRVLVETGDRGYTEQFLELRLAEPAPPGALLTATVTSHDGRRLLGRTLRPEAAGAFEPLGNNTEKGAVHDGQG